MCIECKLPFTTTTFSSLCFGVCSISNYFDGYFKTVNNNGGITFIQIVSNCVHV